MKVTTRENEYNTKDIIMEAGSKTFTIMFGGTLDLYWMIQDKSINNQDDHNYELFEITKENYQIYEAFEILFEDIKNINLFDRDEFDFPPYVETDEERKEYLLERELIKQEYKKYNVSYYNDLYNQNENVITWVSDETAYEIANVLKIKKEDEKFIIEIYTQDYIEGYEREQNYFGTLGIRFRNSGSRYDPFNSIFMRMYGNLQGVDDVLDFNHQIHMEEYLYERKLIKK